MNTSLRPTEAPRNATKARTEEIKQGRKYGWSRRYANFPNVSGQRTAGLENTPPIIGLENSVSGNGHAVITKKNLRKRCTYAQYSGNIRKGICDICFVRYLQCCQLQNLITIRYTSLANHRFGDT